MSLDDAVNAAKARQDQQARIDRGHQERKEREETEIKALLQEAAERLSLASRSEQFVKVAPALLFGRYTSGGKRYGVARRDRCWVLSTGEARRAPSAETVPSSVLLLESGIMARFYQEEDFHPQLEGEYVTSSSLVLLGDHDLFWGNLGTSRIDALKRALGTAIVAYGAA
ncbi:hypothetical protein ACFW3Z_19885 [Nocardiopsis alba]|uniref:hypothetical protein n=1 Tax=Nocardiopsis alba TaxID=53437 RepID=UPI00366C60C6